MKKLILLMFILTVISNFSSAATTHIADEDQPGPLTTPTTEI